MFVRALSRLAYIEFLLRTRSLEETCRRLAVLPPHEASVTSVLPKPEQLASVTRAIATLERRAFRIGCLRRALLAGALLSPFGPRLEIGVRLRPTVIAHAWISMGQLELFKGDGPDPVLLALR